MSEDCSDADGVGTRTPMEFPYVLISWRSESIWLVLIWCAPIIAFLFLGPRRGKFFKVASPHSKNELS